MTDEFDIYNDSNFDGGNGDTVRYYFVLGLNI